MKTIRLNCNRIISCRIPLPLPPCGCAVARATRARSMLLCCRLHPREPCQHPAAGMGLTPSSPVLPPIAGGSQPLASSSCCSADGHLHGRDRSAAQLHSIEHPGRWNNAPQTCSSARLHLQEVRGTRFVLNEEIIKEKILRHHLRIIFFWWFPICLLSSPRPSPPHQQKAATCLEHYMVPASTIST